MCVSICECNHCYKRGTCTDCQFNSSIKDGNCHKDGVQGCVFKIEYPRTLASKEVVEND
jgi:hypothetical protein